MGATFDTPMDLLEGPSNFDAPQLPMMTPFGQTNPIIDPSTTLPDTSTDWSTHPLIRSQVTDHLIALIAEVRRQRQPLEDEWRAIDRMEMLIHDSNRRYYGRHDSFLPIWANNKDVLVAQYMRGLFPSDEYMDVSDRSTGDPQRAKPVKAVLQWEFEANAQLRRHVEAAMGQLVSQGNTVWMRYYNREVRREGRLAEINGVPQLTYAPRKREGLKVSPRSIFSFYLWPTTAASMEEATLVFEDVDVPLTQIDYLVKSGKWTKAALDAPDIDTHHTQQAEVHSNLFGIAPPQRSTLASNYMGSVKTLTFVYTTLLLPREALTPDEDPECPYPVRIVMAGNEPVECKRNPYLDQLPPYDFHATRRRPSFPYGYGEGKLALAIQAGVNDAFNQWLDNGEYQLNPVWVADMNAIAAPPPSFFPGMIIPSIGGEGLTPLRPPYEQLQYGQNIIMYLRSLEEELTRAPAQSQGNASSQTKTATQAQILQRNSSIPGQTKVEGVEYGMLIPLMRATWMMEQQYRDKSVLLTVAGQPFEVTPQSLIIDAEMRWLASSQAINQATRSQAMAVLLNIAMQPQVLQVLMSLGYIVDPAVMINRMYSDQGFRGFDSFIRKMTPEDQVRRAMMMQMQANANGAGQDAQAKQKKGDRARSATEQSGQGSTGDVVPGEAEEFMNVRQGADEMAGAAGGMNGRFG